MISLRVSGKPKPRKGISLHFRATCRRSLEKGLNVTYPRGQAMNGNRLSQSSNPMPVSQEWFPRRGTSPIPLSAQHPPAPLRESLTLSILSPWRDTMALSSSSAALNLCRVGVVRPFTAAISRAWSGAEEGCSLGVCKEQGQSLLGLSISLGQLPWNSLSPGEAGSAEGAWRLRLSPFLQKPPQVLRFPQPLSPLWPPLLRRDGSLSGSAGAPRATPFPPSLAPPCRKPRFC